MTPELFVIIDDRETPPPELLRLIGDIQFGDLLRRRRRYVDELVAATAGADEAIVLRSQDDADRLVRKIENARGKTLWFRIPTVIAPLDMSHLDFLIRKMRFALEPVRLTDVFEDDAPMVLFPREAIDIVTAEPGRSRRSRVLQLQQNALQISHELHFVDLRQPENLRQFLSGATEPRGFNNLAADGGVFVKSSPDVEKMKAEHDFYALASPQMQRFLLPTYGFKEKDGVASYQMEHLRVPDAALQFVLGTFTENNLEQLLDQFFAYLASRERKPMSRSEVQEKGRLQISKKLEERLAAFSATPEGAKVDGILMSGGVEGGLSGLHQRVVLLVDKALSGHSSDYLAFSHGDPCFSNILFDSRIGLVKLIDPRGATAREDAFMHPLYDLAKFSHSICGGYDFVNNALFSVEVDGDLSLDLRHHRGGAASWIHDEFRIRLATEGWVYSQVRAVEASLFLSMLPLHLDHPRKLLGFALTARNIIEELESQA